MSLEVDLAVLAEGAAADARGNLTLVAANPHLLLADELPVQFAPVFLVVVNEPEEELLTPGRLINAKIEVSGPDGETLFVSQLRQAVTPPPAPAVTPRLNLISQIPFTASKIGTYKFTAHIEAIGSGNQAVGEITATRTVRVADRASLGQSGTS